MFKKYLFILVLAIGAHSPLLHAKAPEPKTHQIEIQSFVFVPARIEVQAGDVVEWINRDFAPHTAAADNGNWDTDLIKNGAMGRTVTTLPGLVAYHCAFHPQMKGVLVVTSPTTASTPPTQIRAKENDHATVPTN